MFPRTMEGPENAKYHHIHGLFVQKCTATEITLDVRPRPQSWVWPSTPQVTGMFCFVHLATTHYMLARIMKSFLTKPQVYVKTAKHQPTRRPSHLTRGKLREFINLSHEN
ncbi:hypothetical protein CBL_05772 [Carabus blaptoides fortunei]